MTGRTAVIAGVAESDAVGRVPDATVLGLAAEAADNAIRDADLTPAAVDGLFAQGSGLRERYDFPQLAVAEYLGVEPPIASSNDLGGASAFGHLQYARLAIEAGLIDVALVTYGSTNYTDRQEGRNQYPPEDPILTRQYDAPYGSQYPIGAYAMAARRYMHEFDVTQEDLAHVAVSTREWARLNPKAMQHEDLTVADVLDSPPVCTPLHKYDCCLVSDAGGAVVLAAEDALPADRDAPPVEIAGLAEQSTHEGISQMRDLTLPGAHESAARAYKQANMRPSDVDVAELYDSFTITAALLTESVGLADRGKGTMPFATGTAAPGGDTPINTSGGGLSYCHPGTYGILAIVEAVRQVRGDYRATNERDDERQVDDAEVALAHGAGGVLSAHATMLLRCEATRSGGVVA